MMATTLPDTLPAIPTRIADRRPPERAQRPAPSPDDTLLDLFAMHLRRATGAERDLLRAIDTYAARIAGALAARGVGPGDRIGVALAHVDDALAGLIGVLSAGATCALLPPDHAPDASLSIVLGEGAGRLDPRDLPRGPIDAATDWPGADADEPAYVVTPRTGAPGQPVLHRDAVAALRAAGRLPGLGHPALDALAAICGDGLTAR